MLFETRKLVIAALSLLPALGSAQIPEVTFSSPSRIGIIHESYTGIADAVYYDTATPAVQINATLQINMTSSRNQPVVSSPGTPFFFIPVVSKFIALNSSTAVQYGHLAPVANQALRLTVSQPISTSVYPAPTLQKAYVADDVSQVQQFWAFNTATLELKFVGKAYSGPVITPVGSEYGAIQPKTFPATLQLGPVKVAPGLLYLRPQLVVDPPPTLSTALPTNTI